MSNFDKVARDWDSNPIHWERSEAIASKILETIPLTSNMKALEYGAGTGILSFLLADKLSEITLMDNSKEMVEVMKEKVLSTHLNHLKPLFFDFEHTEYHNNNFDFIFNQMVLHHVDDVETVLNKFYKILNTNSFLAIADLFSEDGSFHGPDVKVHFGFSPDKLSELLTAIGFRNISYSNCYEIKRDSGKLFPIFLLVAQK